MVSRSAVVCILLAVGAVSATNVRQCKGRSYSGLSSNVQLSPCPKIPCKLKKGTDQHISIAFKPEKDLKVLKNKVEATVFGVPLPFPGVDGNSVCDKIYTESGEKAPCPLRADNTYVYKDSFPVLKIYPTLEVDVHWALLDASDQDVICFEVPAKIV